ncbi:MAG: PDDEXK nuclease domain-containing protein [Elusimicrobiota bacterium]|jgi:predicted nuclease of restriction endonuclease-like (RecB) superfamily|nr:PDDEXK nuclease domain-containing protein [Elusimicrobiota bacterium]
MKIIDQKYRSWLKELKSRIRQSQIKAAIKVNSELLCLYWDLGRDIVLRKMDAEWGSGFFGQLSKELRAEFPDMQGFSETNLKYCKRFFEFYIQDESGLCQLSANSDKNGAIIRDIAIRQQLADEFESNPIFQIPWFHNVQIFTKCKSIKEAIFYVQKTIENGWSRAVLMNFLEADLYSAQGKAITNFKAKLPKPQSDLALQITKDPYNLDFLTIRGKFDEKELGKNLLEHLSKFLLELGSGFSFIGNQYKLSVGGEDFYVDLLFYHTRLHCYIAIELKTVVFKAEFSGKLGFYVSVIDDKLKTKGDNPTIGILICKSKNETVVKYALQGVKNPIGVSDYQIMRSLPKDFRSSLPSVEEIEKELEKSAKR